MEPDDAEEFVDYLISIKRFDEAATHLADVLLKPSNIIVLLSYIWILFSLYYVTGHFFKNNKNEEKVVNEVYFIALILIILSFV